MKRVAWGLATLAAVTAAAYTRARTGDDLAMMGWTLVAGYSCARLVGALGWQAPT